MTRIGHWIAVGAALMLAACQSPTATSSNGANPDDVDFVTNAYQIIMFDRQEGELAQSQATDPQVRALAAKMVGEANVFAEKLGPLGTAAGIQPPDILSYRLRVRLGHMRLQHGLDFDQTFVDDQIASHQELLSMHEMMVYSRGNSALRQLAEAGRSLLQANLRQLQALQRKMMLQ